MEEEPSMRLRLSRPDGKLFLIYKAPFYRFRWQLA